MPVQTLIESPSAVEGPDAGSGNRPSVRIMHLYRTLESTGIFDG